MSFLDSYIEPFKILSDDTDEFIFLKDTDSVYKWCSSSYARLLNVCSNKIFGLKDADINPLHSDLYVEDDKKVILTAKTLLVDNPAYFKGLGISRVYGFIKPIIDDDGRVEGIFGRTKLKFNLSGKSLTEVFALINEVNMPYMISEKGYKLQTKYGTVKISSREVECFLYLLKGCSAKEISRFMDLQTKTIDSYVFNLKVKFSCRSKSELFSIVLNAGLLDMLSYS